MPLQFGLLVPQGWQLDLVGIPDSVEAYETMTRVARVAEEVDFDSIWLFDHFHTAPTVTQEVTFECWTSTAALARDTRRIRIGQLVTCNGYRNPALLAKMASTMDALSHGRLIFGIGAGWYQHEFHAYGYDYPDAPTRLRHLREAVQIIREMWTKEEAVFEGRYYQVRGAINQPKGVQKPNIPLLIGGSGEQVTLKLVAQYGDACNFNAQDIESLKHKFAVLKHYCDAIGRDSQEIHRTARYETTIAETDDEALHLAYQSDIPDKRTRERDLVGSPATIRRRLQEIEEAGVQEVILFFRDSVRRFAETCIEN